MEMGQTKRLMGLKTLITILKELQQTVAFGSKQLLVNVSSIHQEIIRNSQRSLEYQAKQFNLGNNQHS